MRLLEFLKARLDEDEQVAMTAANGKPENYGRWDYGGGDYDAPGRGEVYAPDASGPDSTGFMDYHYVTCDSEGLLPAVETEQATHIARHNPARVLREVAAKRQLLAEFADQSCLSCSSMSGGDVLSDNVLRTLASAYSDHSDYERTLWDGEPVGFVHTRGPKEGQPITAEGSSDDRGTTLRGDEQL